MTQDVTINKEQIVILDWLFTHRKTKIPLHDGFWGKDETKMNLSWKDIFDSSDFIEEAKMLSYENLIDRIESEVKEGQPKEFKFCINRKGFDFYNSNITLFEPFINVRKEKLDSINRKIAELKESSKKNKEYDKESNIKVIKDDIEHINSELLNSNSNKTEEELMLELEAKLKEYGSQLEGINKKEIVDETKLTEKQELHLIATDLEDDGW